MLPLILGAAGLGAGGLKYLFGKRQQDKDNQAAAETTRYSPWTGLKGQLRHDEDLFGDLFAGGATGAQLGSGIESANAYQSYLKSQEANPADVMKKVAGNRGAAVDNFGKSAPPVIETPSTPAATPEGPKNYKLYGYPGMNSPWTALRSG